MLESVRKMDSVCVSIVTAPSGVSTLEYCRTYCFFSFVKENLQDLRDMVPSSLFATARRH